MKIYTEIRIDIETLEVIDEKSFEYDGPLALCGSGGGGSDTTTVDPVFNAGMLELSEAQWDTAEQFVNQYFYGTTYDPNEELTGYYGEDGKFVESEKIPNPDYVAGHYEYPGATVDSWGNPVDPGRVWVEAKGEEFISTATGKEEVKITRGEVQGYYKRNEAGELVKADGSKVSESDYNTSVIQANYNLLDEQTKTALAQEGLTQEQIGQAMTLLPEITDTELAKMGLTRAQITSALETLPSETQAAISANNAKVAQSQTTIDTAAGTTAATNAQNQTTVDTAAGNTAATNATNRVTTDTAASSIYATNAENEAAGYESQARHALVPSSYEASLAGNVATKAENEMRSAIVPSATDATISGNVLTTSQNTAGLDLVRPKTDLELAQIADTRSAINERSPVRSEFFQQSLNGINPTDRMNQSQAEVEQSAAKQLSQTQQQMADAGVNMDPSSGSYRSLLNQSGLNTARNVASARTNARTTTEAENYERLRSAMNVTI